MSDIRRRLTDERGSVLVLALFIMALLMATGVVLLRMSGSETDIAYNTVWSEGSFYAAEAALSIGIDQLGPTLVTNVALANTALGPQFTQQGNVQFLGTTAQPGYSLGSGTGYNPSGYVFFTYTVTGTGTGPRNAQRQVEVRASFGPVAQ
jgi:Tfp pilus assembly protein PilX